MELNINYEVEDTFYRYKMPKLSAKVEGKGNGIKTVIVNVTDIARSLYRKPIYVTKYFGCELGAQIYVDDKNDRYIVNGSHESAKLQELLNGFIKKFVLCSNCGNPETTLNVNKRASVVNTSCKACGNRGQLDPRHRLTQYIIKNPPAESVPTVERCKGKKGRKVRNGPDQISDEDKVIAIEDNGTTISNKNIQSYENDEDWGEETSEEAQLQRLNELSDMARALALGVNVEKSDTERANMFFKLVSELKEDGKILVSRDIKAHADQLKLGGKAVLVVVEVLLSDPSTIVSDIEKYRTTFTQFTRVGIQAKKVQGYFLGAIAVLIDKFSDHCLQKKACHIIKSLYDNDIVEEDVILSWFMKDGAKRYVSRKLADEISLACQPMLKWLKEAEEESDSDEELQINIGHEVNCARDVDIKMTDKCDSQFDSDFPDDEIDIDAI